MGTACFLEHLDTISPVHHTCPDMRLTVSLDDDLYNLAKAVAKAHDCSLSAAINRLLRRAVEPRGMPSKHGSSDLPIIRCRTRFTSDDVDRLEALTDEL